METYQVKAGAIEESTSVLQSQDASTVEDDANKVTVKCLESFNAKRLRIPKRPQEGNDEIFKSRRDFQKAETRH